MAIILKRGMKGEEVKTLQRYLHLMEDGIFGMITEDAVKDFQKKNGLTPDGIVGPMTWAALIPCMFKKSKRTIKEIIVHCSATPEGRHHTVEDVRQWHKANGWADVGYHYLIYLDGSIHTGRDVDKIGAHCGKDGHNTYSIGVCYIGGEEGELNAKGQIVAKKKNGRPIDKDTRTKWQKESLIYLLKELRKLYPKAVIVGHHDFDKSKSCPCFAAKTEYANI